MGQRTQGCVQSKQVEEKMIKYKLTITPALLPYHRHIIEALLVGMGYSVSGGGTKTDLSSCDISFGKREFKRKVKP